MRFNLKRLDEITYETNEKQKRALFKNFNLNHEGFEENLIRKMPKFDGVAYMFRFANDYGASVIKHEYSYGYDDDQWELRVLRFAGDNYEFACDTPITGDVEGCLTDKEVRNLLKEIKEL